MGIGIRYGSVQSNPGGSGFRFVRLQFLNATTDIEVRGSNNSPTGNEHRFGFLTPSGFIPVNRQTSATTPLVVTQSSAFAASYDGWKAFVDYSSWNTKSSPLDVNPWLQVDFGETLNTEITGIRFVSVAINSNAFRVFTSPTGAFSGEETLVGEKTGVVWTGGFAIQEFTF